MAKSFATVRTASSPTLAIWASSGGAPGAADVGRPLLEAVRLGGDAATAHVVPQGDPGVVVRHDERAAHARERATEGRGVRGGVATELLPERPEDPLSSVRRAGAERLGHRAEDHPVRVGERRVEQRHGLAQARPQVVVVVVRGVEDLVLHPGRATLDPDLLDVGRARQRAVAELEGVVELVRRRRVQGGHRRAGKGDEVLVQHHARGHRVAVRPRRVRVVAHRARAGHVPVETGAKLLDADRVTPPGRGRRRVPGRRGPAERIHLGAPHMLERARVRADPEAGQPRRPVLRCRNASSLVAPEASRSRPGTGRWWPLQSRPNRAGGRALAQRGCRALQLQQGDGAVPRGGAAVGGREAARRDEGVDEEDGAPLCEMRPPATARAIRVGVAGRGRRWGTGRFPEAAAGVAARGTSATEEATSTARAARRRVRRVDAGRGLREVSFGRPGGGRADASILSRRPVKRREHRIPRTPTAQEARGWPTRGPWRSSPSPAPGVPRTTAWRSATSCWRARHRVVFVVDASFEGELEKRGFEERVFRMAPEEAQTDPTADPWAEFIRVTAPEFRKPTIEQVSTVTLPIWEALVAGEQYAHGALMNIWDDVRPDVVCTDNVTGYPAVELAGAPWVRFVSANPLEMRDPDLPPVLSGLPVDDRA